MLVTAVAPDRLRDSPSPVKAGQLEESFRESRRLLSEPEASEPEAGGGVLHGPDRAPVIAERIVGGVALRTAVLQ